MSSQGNPETRQPVFAVFSGGGMKAVAFVGALNEAETRVRIAGVGGTSAGAIVAALLACGYSVDETKAFLFDAPYASFFQKRWFWWLNARSGVFHSRRLREWLRTKIGLKVKNDPLANVTFGELKGAKGSLPLRIVATNLTKQDIKVYSAERTLDQDVASAVVTSCAYPLAFPPTIEGEDELVDGGLVSNFPMWLFDDLTVGQVGSPSILGFALVPKLNRRQVSSRVLDYLKLLLDALLVSQDCVQERYLQPSRPANVIRILTGSVGTFESDLTPHQLMELYESGRHAAQDYFRTQPGTQTRVGKYRDNPVPDATARFGSGDSSGAVKIIAREHLLRGGIAEDSGIATPQVRVKYYVDLMEAVISPPERDLLAKILVAKVQQLSLANDVAIAGIKMGNPLLAARTAELLGKRLVLVKTNLSWKPGVPFDGVLDSPGRFVLVDDVASDKSPLLQAVQQLRKHGHYVEKVVALIKRPEGDAGKALQEAGCPLAAVCTLGDSEIEKIVDTPP